MTLKEIEALDLTCSDNCPGECSNAPLVRELIFRLKQKLLFEYESTPTKPITNLKCGVTRTGEVKFG